MSLKYEERLNTIMKVMKMKAEKENKSHTVSLDYLNKHNNICPGCNKGLSTSKDKINNIGSFGFIELYNKKDTLYMYGICGDCTNAYGIGSDTEYIENNIELNLSRKLGIKL